ITQMPETFAGNVPRRNFWRRAGSSYLRLLVDPSFMGRALAGSFGVASLFVYLGSSSFILMNHYGLTSTLFSICLALNAVSFFGFSQFTGKLTKAYGLPRVVRVTVIGFVATMIVLALAMHAGIDNLYVMIVLLLIGYGFLGLVLPTTTVLAMEQHGAI